MGRTDLSYKSHQKTGKMDTTDTIGSFEEAQQKYNEIYLFWQQMEDQIGLDESVYDKMIAEFKIVEAKILHEGIISPNEEFEEILPENLKYLVMPVVHADLLTKKTRQNGQLDKAIVQYVNFIQLMIHYHLCPPKLVNLFEQIKKDPKLTMSRNDKVNIYKETKEVEEKLQI